MYIIRRKVYRTEVFRIAAEKVWLNNRKSSLLLHFGAAELKITS